jgi:O-antigen ligase
VTGASPLTTRAVLPTVFVFGGAALGLVAVRSPFAALAGIVGLGFVVAVLWNLVAGLSLFTLMIFFGQLGSGASAVKLAGLLLTLAWVVTLLRRDRAVPFMPRDRPGLAYSAGVFTAWAVFSILWAADAGAASTTAFRLVLNFVLFLLVFSALGTVRSVRTIMLSYVLGAALTSLYGVSTGTTQADTAAGGRLGGGIGDPNELAALILPGLVFAVFLLALERGFFLRLLLAASCLVFLTTIFFTQSRGGIVALGVVILSGLAFGGPIRGRIAAGSLALGALAVVMFVLVAPPSSLGRLGSFTGGGGSGRLDLWKVATEVIGNHPVAGVGAGNFPVVEPAYAANAGNLPRVDLVLDDTKVVHNTYLNILTDLGLVGFVPFVALLLAVVVSTVRAVRRFEARGDPVAGMYGRAILIGVLGMLGAFTFLSAQYEKQLWLVLGLAAALSSSSFGRRTSPPPDHFSRDARFGPEIEPASA